MNWKSKNQFLTSLSCSGRLTSLFKSTNQPCCCQSTCCLQYLCIRTCSLITLLRSKHQQWMFSLHLLQVSALYLIFALPFITVADGISYLTRIRTHSGCQKCFKNLYRPRVSLQNGHFILIRKSFLLRKFPTMQYMPYSLIHLEPLETHNIVPNMSFIQRFHYN